MGHAKTYQVPRNVAVIALIECVLSFMVTHLVLAGSAEGNLIPVPATSLTSQGNYVATILALAAGMVTLTMGMQGGISFLERKRLILAGCIAGLVALPAILIVCGSRFVLFETAASMMWIARILVAWLAVILAFRIALSSVLRRARPRLRRILMIGDPKRVEAVSRRLQSARARRFEPLICDPSALCWPSLREQNISAIVVNAIHEQALSGALLDCKLRGMPVISDLVFQERHLGRIDLEALTASDIVFSEGYADKWPARILKRGCDVTLSLVMLLLTLPLMCLTALAIKADTSGPVFYRQQRIGKFGHPFTLLKFRSMSVDAEPGGNPLWAQKRDPRVTKVGAFIRATQIDELPQLANVILGQMSLVGPRPERPHFVSQLNDAIPFYRERHYVKPGVTGWAQVNYPYGASVEDAREKLAYDLYYVKHRGIVLDILILLSTVRVVLFREGAR